MVAVMNKDIYIDLCYVIYITSFLKYGYGRWLCDKF